MVLNITFTDKGRNCNARITKLAKDNEFEAFITHGSVSLRTWFVKSEAEWYEAREQTFLQHETVQEIGKLIDNYKWF